MSKLNPMMAKAGPANDQINPFSQLSQQLKFQEINEKYLIDN